MKHLRFRGFIIACLFVLFLVTAGSLSLSGALGEDTDTQNTSPLLRNEIISPRNSKEGDTMIFKVTYQDIDNDSAEYVNLQIDTDSYRMKELDSEDTNYADGKDFYLKKSFDKDNYLFYFEASDGTNTTTTMVNTFSVTVKYEFQWHLDIAAVLTAFIVLAVFIIHYLKQLSNNMTALIQQTQELLEQSQAAQKCLAPLTDSGEGYLEGERKP